jgi:hypothetical protein
LTAVSTPAVFDATTSIRKRILRRVQHTRPRHFLRPEVRTRSPVVARVSSAWLSGARGGRGRGHRWILIQPVHAPCPPGPPTCVASTLGGFKPPTPRSRSAAGPNLAEPRPSSFFSFLLISLPVNPCSVFEIPQIRR